MTAQGTTEPIDPWAHVSGLTLADYEKRPEAQPFSDEFWVVNETEHGSGGPERLHGFTAFLSHPGRNEEVDRTLLVPYFLRYLWEVDYPLYTREAWRLLARLVPDPALLVDVARTVLERHSHSELRAAILEPQDDHAPQYLETPEFVALLLRHAGKDPSPAVRRAALQAIVIVLYSKPLDGLAEAVAAALDDTAFEVRAAAVSIIGMLWDRFETSIGTTMLRSHVCAVLEDADNAPVLHSMLGALTGRFQGDRVDADLIASALNGLAAQRSDPMFADMQHSLAWFLIPAGRSDGVVARAWLKRAPFDDGAALVAYLEDEFRNVAAPAAERAMALAGLAKLGRQPNAGIVLEFLLREPQDGDSLDAVRYCYQFWRRVFDIDSVSAPDRAERLRRLMARSHRLAPDHVRRSLDYRKTVCESAVQYAVSKGPDRGEAQQLIDAVFEFVAADDSAVADALWALEHAETALDLSGLRVLVESAQDPYTARRVAEVMAQRYAEQFSVTMLADIERILAANPGPALVADLVSKLPMPSELASRPDQLARLHAAVEHAAERAGRIAAESDLDYDRWMAQRIRDWFE